MDKSINSLIIMINLNQLLANWHLIMDIFDSYMII